MTVLDESEAGDFKGRLAGPPREVDTAGSGRTAGTSGTRGCERSGGRRPLRACEEQTGIGFPESREFSREFPKVLREKCLLRKYVFSSLSPWIASINASGTSRATLQMRSPMVNV
jgi:hypothetical protein